MQIPLFTSACLAHQSEEAAESTSQASSGAPHIPVLHHPPCAFPHIWGKAEEGVSFHTVANWHHPLWMSVSWYGGAVKSPDCQKCYSWEIGTLSIFCSQCFRISIPGWKTISMQNTEQGCWEFKPFIPLSKCQHFLIPTGKGKKKCLHSQGPNACSSFPCHQMPHYCITQPRDLIQEQSFSRG